MVDTKISGYPLNPTPSLSDLIITVKDPTGSPTNWSLTLQAANEIFDHGLLVGLGDDDHTQYYNAARHTLAIHEALGLGLPGGSDTNVQVNVGDVFGAYAGFTFDGDILVVPNIISTGLYIRAYTLRVQETGGVFHVDFIASNLSGNVIYNLPVFDAAGFLQSDGAGELAWSAGTGTTVPGGSNLQLQYNNAGAFGGASNTEWDEEGQVLTVPYLLVPDGMTAAFIVTGAVLFQNIAETKLTRFFILQDQIDDNIEYFLPSEQTTGFLYNNGIGSLSWEPTAGGGGGGGGVPTLTFSIPGVPTVGANKTCSFIIPTLCTIVKVYAYSRVAPTGANIIFDINKNGTSIWNVTQANRLKILAGANSGTQTSFDTTALAEGDIIDIDIDQVGSTIEGSDITVEIKVTT